MSIGIYRFQNQITKESYIGQSINLEERYNRHKRSYINGTTDFYQAIQQYGWNNFSYEILEYCPVKDLNDREVYWIAYYNSYHNGYNMNKGGSNKSSVDYEQVFDLWKQGKKPKEISELMGIGLSTTYIVLNSFPESASAINSNEVLEKFKVYQYDLDGNFIKEWSSRKAVQRELNIYATAIGKVINKERNSAGGYQWTNIYYQSIPPINQTSIPKPIYQYDLNKNYIQTFNAIKEAARAVQGDDSAIRRAALGGLNRSAYGFRWSFEKI